MPANLYTHSRGRGANFGQYAQLKGGERPTPADFSSKVFTASGSLVPILFLADASITASTNILSSTSHTFTADDVGKLVFVFGAGAGGAVLSSSVASIGTGGSAGKAILV